jgi:hypothetical protein
LSSCRWSCGTWSAGVGVVAGAWRVDGAFACPSSEYGLSVPTGPDTSQTLEGSISVLGTFDGVDTLDVTSWDSRQSAPSSCSEVATFVLVR